MTDVSEKPGDTPATPVPDDRRKRKRRPKAGDVAALKRILWQGLKEVETLLTNDVPDLKLRSASALATLGGVYLKALETADLERRISILEQGRKGKTHDD